MKAAGDGRIVHLGWKGGYGRTIVIQHGTRYSTLYAHMSRYANNLSAGSRVRQGQVIGYVGQSGLATGPHLHYEFLVDGVHRNPVTVELPDAEPIAQEYRAQFEAQTAPLVAKLDTIIRSDFALQDD
ncbi:M23 family metallopeptidase [Alkalilimnicola ehrlichii]|uniref:M23 family metallopeptidase n=1 Tax=Alkalilimnicola ehrlichii TaxID=351052 RepID=UPI00216327F8|nr:M23 family metallopeptidase [Alkalilimnicola ehrlichii]